VDNRWQLSQFAKQAGEQRFYKGVSEELSGPGAIKLLLEAFSSGRFQKKRCHHGDTETRRKSLRVQELQKKDLIIVRALFCFLFSLFLRSFHDDQPAAEKNKSFFGFLRVSSRRRVSPWWIKIYGYILPFSSFS
jgi:hypothetical protein